MQRASHDPANWAVRVENTWWLIPEFSVARYLRGAPSQTDREKRLAAFIRAAIATEDLKLLEPKILNPKAFIKDNLGFIGERPVLVIDPAYEDVLAGVLTSSDVL